MRDVIQRVIATEAEAKRLIEAATTEAERIMSDANKQRQELAAQARQEAKAEANRLIEAAIQRAERDKQERLASLADEIQKQIRLTETNRQRTVAESVRCVCGQPLMT